MIDLNYLYAYSTHKQKNGPVTAYEYLTANALVKQSKQNFGKYFEGLIAERIDECTCSPDIPINALDIFILALDTVNCSVSDFVSACKNSTSSTLNDVDRLFYNLMPDNRIFGAINELRERGNLAFNESVARPNEIKSYKEICTTDFLFGAPAKLGFADPIVDALARMSHSVDGTNTKVSQVAPSTKELNILLSIFYLTEKNNRLILDTPFAMQKNKNKGQSNAIERICEIVDSSNDYLDIYDPGLLMDRNSLYEDIIDASIIGEYWEHCENYLNGLQYIKSSGEERYTKAKNGTTKPIFEACNNKKVFRSALSSEAKADTLGNDWEDISDFVINKKQCDAFRDRIVGQTSAVNDIIDKLAGVSCGFYTPNRPIASFLMNGPTGVGKTETAKAMADTFFGGRLFTVDMSTFKHPADVSRLIGSAPGYVGYDDKVALLEFLDHNPNGVINFDEIDKCDRSCLSFLLSLLDEGKFTSSKGKEYRVENFVITCTTNQKAEVSRKSENFNLDEMMSRTGDSGTPFVKEFLGRFDGLLEYHDLSKAELKEVLGKKLDAKIKVFENNKPDSRVSIEYRDRLLENILQDANYTATGARALNGSIQKMFIRPISHYLIENPNHQGDRKIVLAGDNQLLVNGKDMGQKTSQRTQQTNESNEHKSSFPAQQYYA